MAFPELIDNSPSIGVAAALTALSGNGGSITTGASSLKVASVAQVPAQIKGVTGQCHIMIDAEIMLIDASTTGGLTWTILQRGVDGTTAASHNDGANVYHVWSGDALRKMAQSNPPSAVAQSANFTAEPHRVNYCTGAITCTLPTAPAADTEVTVLALTGLVTINRGGTDTLVQYQTTGLTTIGCPAGSMVTLKYLSGVWRLVRDGRPIGWNANATAYCNVSQTLTSAASVKIALASVAAGDDPFARFDVANHYYVCPYPGDYLAVGQVWVNTTGVLHTASVGIGRNGSASGASGDSFSLPTSPAGSYAGTAQVLLKCAAGDTIELQVGTDVTTTTAVFGAGSNFLSVARVG